MYAWYGYGSAEDSVCRCDTGAAAIYRQCCRDRPNYLRESRYLFRCGRSNCTDGASSTYVIQTDFAGACQIFIKCNRTDLMMRIDGLAFLVRQKMKLGPFSNTCFCSASGARNVSKLCTERATGSFLRISVWNPGHSSLHGIPEKPDLLPSRNHDSSWMGAEKEDAATEVTGHKRHKNKRTR